MKFPNIGIGRDDEDLFAHTRMSFGDHIEELRIRMIRAILGFLIALVVGLFVGQPVLEFIQAPVQRQLEDFYDARIAAINAKIKQEQEKSENEGHGPFDIKQAKEEIVQQRDSIKDWEVSMRLGAEGEWKTVTLRVDPKYLDVPDEQEKDRDRDVEAQLWDGGDGAWKAVTLRAKAKDIAVAEGPTRELDVTMRMGKDGQWQPATLRLNPNDIAALTAWKTMVQRYSPKARVVGDSKAERELNRPASLTTLTVTEAFMTYFMVSIYCGIVLASPWIFWQLWQFVAAGLYPHEKKYVYMYLPLSLALFLGGCALSEFVVLPLGIRYLLSFNEWLGVEPELRLSEWLSFAVMVPLIFGCAFQTPLIMLFLERMGIVKIELYTKNRKMAIFILAIAAAFLAAAPDALNMMLLAIPLWGLYEFGILLCRFAPRAKQELEEPDPEEMVEV
jgi:Tat protein translocase TatC